MGETNSPTSGIRDWTLGPAKWAAVIVLGVASLSALGWAIFFRAPRPDLIVGRAVVPQVDPTQDPAAQADEPVAPVLRGRVNINTANAAELEMLPGIGPSLAQRIIDDRKEHGAYLSVEQLDRVRGIGPKTLEKLKPLVTVE